MKPVYKISVGELVEYAVHSGDLGVARASHIRGWEGTRAHQKIQQSRPEGYQAEVVVRHTVSTNALDLEISGRIDGVHPTGSDTILEEIKSTRQDLAQLEVNPVHLAQAKVYAYIYGLQQKLNRLTIHLTYVHLDTEEQRIFQEACPFAELAVFFNRIVKIFTSWAERVSAWELTRNQSLQQAVFPFPAFRKGQEELIEAASLALDQEARLFAEAPTGTGKTLSILWPAVQAVCDKRMAKIFYLSAKTSGKAIAEKAFADMRGSGLRFKTLTLTAKEKVCCKAGTPCDPAACEYAIGYYDRINAAIADLFETHDAWTREHIETYANKHKVCPFEYSLDLSWWADAIICDYNYVFDPRVYLRRYFEERHGRYALLVDEAHNLVSRARDMFSASLCKQAILQLKRTVQQPLPLIARQLTALNRHFVNWRKTAEAEDHPNELVMLEPPDELLRSVRGFIFLAEAWLAGNEKPDFKQAFLEFYFEASAFAQIAERYDRHYVTYYAKERRRETIKMLCLDPSDQLRKSFRRGKAAILFSATLSPMPYFLQVLGGHADDAQLQLDTPFPPENLQVELAVQVPTTYRQRESSSPTVANLIRDFTEAANGNYLVFFPSYAYLRQVLERVRPMLPFAEILEQQPGMSEPEREEFIGAFRRARPTTLIGFVVMGGVFGEAIDLVGEHLIGAVIVGVGLPMVCLEQELIRAYYTEQDLDGFDYAYTYPGISRVLQSVGRVIRTETDKGRVLLIDRRFGTPLYRALLPKYWHNVKKV